MCSLLALSLWVHSWQVCTYLCREGAFSYASCCEIIEWFQATGVPLGCWRGDREL